MHVLCRVNKAPAISSYATECNRNLCTVGGDYNRDISTFWSIYNDYYKKNGYTLQGAAAPASAEPTEPTKPTEHVVLMTTTVFGDPTAGTVTRITHATTTVESSVGSVTTTTTGLAGPTRTQKTVDVTVWTTVKPTTSDGDEGGGGGLNRSDNIPLGVGIEIGVPAVLVGIAGAWLNGWGRGDHSIQR
ncbi:hypothetical protein QBC38DRAFT_549636 [Podospora fimiseda]|uniref:Uncharacterized protein n=1 Tax=Podospora fimiseda TaxID=252190 RepID=A0AAN7BDP2_9PEZI|nr:hypothetical protein QBC38DRAFT_549636 [Podospora fimiseda]